MKGQQHAELARGNVVLCGQLLIEQMNAGIEEPHQKAEPLVELERVSNFLRLVRGTRIGLWRPSLHGTLYTDLALGFHALEDRFWRRGQPIAGKHSENFSGW